MDVKMEYARWLSSVRDDALLRELADIKTNDAEITDRFYRDLEFGTGGLRGKMGAGTNRMNLLTVGKATQGMAEYLLKSFATPSVCIAYDTRNMSQQFAEQAASVLCANGIRVCLFDGVRPTPMLSFAVRFKKASAGIVITASHNPKEYNGYKVYGADGGQITDLAAGEILARIGACDIFAGVKNMPLEAARSSGLLEMLSDDVDAPYYEKVKSLVMRSELVRERASELKVVYSPLHGSGNIPVRRVLSELGLKNVTVVKEQELPDGNFPTAPYPNPEEPSVYALATELAKRENPDLIFATDPDCDRIGVLVKNSSGEFSVLTGNQTGALLCDYIIRTKNELGVMPPNPAVIKTIVTSDIGKRICEKHSVSMFETLTGFKYIGELAERWQHSGEHSFLLGFEESYGYLSGDFVRDKDGVIAAALIAEMALYYKTQGMSLYDALGQLFKAYGYFAEKLISITMPGQDGQQKIASIIENLRENYRDVLSDVSVSVFEDYQRSTRVFADGASEPLTLPKSNVLKFIFDDGSWFVLRPSGTEPKVKMYLSATGGSEDAARDRLGVLEGLCDKLKG